MTINHKDIAVGVEAANGFVKGLSSISETGQVDTYLNTLTKSNEDEYNQFKNGISKTEVYYINGEYYKVGLQKAKGLEQLEFATRNDVKYDNPLWQTAFIIAVYRQIKNAPSLTVSKIFVTTGLPANDDKKGSIKKKLREAFVKIHCVNDQKFSIDDLYFIGQGSASFYNDLFNVNEEGESQPNKKFLAETAPANKNSVSKIMYVDFGFSTLDYKLVIDYTIQDKSIEDDGMKTIWNEILNRVIKANEANEWLIGVDVLEVEEQIREGKKIELNYQEADISEVFNEVMMEYARKAIQKLYVGDFDNMVYDQVRFLGGGSIPLKPFLEKAIEEYHKGNKGRMDAYKFLENPQTTNCRGYLKFAQANVKKMREKELVK